MTRVAVISIALWFVSACGPSVPTKRPQTSDPCVDAQAALLELECKDEGRLLGGTTKRGLTFDKLCKQLIEQGVMDIQQARCLSQITDCKQVDSTCSWGG